MSDALSFVEIEGQLPELLPARTVMSLMHTGGCGNGGRGGDGGEGRGGVGINLLDITLTGDQTNSAANGTGGNGGDANGGFGIFCF